MTAAIVNDVEIIGAFRQLYRQALRAVQYSKPARYVVRNRIRAAFRRSSRRQYNGERIQNTMMFLQGATETRGIEHRILKTILHVRFWEADRKRRAYS
jgi:hypothetical protein